MVRKYKPISTRGKYGEQNLADALKAVQEGMALIRASKNFGVPARTLRRHRDGAVSGPGLIRLGPVETVLPSHVEQEMHDHIQYMEKAMYGLTTDDVRRLAFDIAEAYKLNHPFNMEIQRAGKDWLQGFFSRYPDLSIRQPQGTNLSRAIAFNRPKVQQFFDVYGEILQTAPFLPNRIWNMDETGITNVHKPGKIIASRGVRQVSKITSGERGKTVTVICAMSASGVYLPPMLIFPRKRMVDSLMHGAPPQSIGCCSPNGWTDSDLFVKWLMHFIQFTNSSKQSQHVIILDGHHSHKSLAAINVARDHGIHLITLPPHSTHKMQPLDRTYFKSLKAAYNLEADSWMIGNPGKRISFPDMAGIFGKAFLRSATPDKAIQGFKSCGIWPYDANIFTDEDFAAANVTDEILVDRPETQLHASNAVELPTTSGHLQPTETRPDPSSIENLLTVDVGLPGNLVHPLEESPPAVTISTAELKSSDATTEQVDIERPSCSTERGWSLLLYRVISMLD